MKFGEGCHTMHNIKLHQTILNTITNELYLTVGKQHQTIPYNQQTASNDPLSTVLRKKEDRTAYKYNLKVLD